MTTQTKIIIGVSGAALVGLLIWKLSQGRGSAKSFSQNCSNIQGMTSVKNCVANGVSKYLGSALVAPGSCATVRVNVGLLTTNVTGGGC